MVSSLHILRLILFSNLPLLFPVLFGISHAYYPASFYSSLPCTSLPSSFSSFSVFFFSSSFFCLFCFFLHPVFILPYPPRILFHYRFYNGSIYIAVTYSWPAANELFVSPRMSRVQPTAPIFQPISPFYPPLTPTFLALFKMPPSKFPFLMSGKTNISPQPQSTAPLNNLGMF